MSTSETSASALPAAPPSLLPPIILPIAAALFLITSLGPNLALAWFAICVLLAGSALLWRPGETPIFLLIFGYHWLQASSATLFSNITGIDIEDFAPYGGREGDAIALTLISLLVLAAGMRLGAGRWRWQDGERVRNIMLARPVSYWFRLYAIAVGLSFVVLSFVWVIPGLRQPILALGNFKWAFFWLLAYATFAQQRAPKSYFIAAFIFEFLLGLGGFFSDFKNVIFFSIFGVLASGVRFSRKAIAGIAISGVVLISLGIVWTVVKTPFRVLISGGGQEQIVTLDYVTRLQSLGDLISLIDGEAVQIGAQGLINRLSYVEFFGVILTTVPATHPHADGAIWGDAVLRPLMPRLLFPDKEAIDDTERTYHYTNGLIAVGDVTSVSIGYFSEAYIDFGAWGMMVPIFLLGYVYGRIYRWLVSGRNRYGPLGMALATAVLYGGLALESSATKIVGGIAVSSLVAWLIIRFAAPIYFRWTFPDSGVERA